MKLYLSGASRGHILKPGSNVKVRLTVAAKTLLPTEEGTVISADGTGLLLFKTPSRNILSTEKTEIFIPWTSILEVFPEPQPIGSFVKDVENLWRHIRMDAEDHKSWKEKFEAATSENEALKITNQMTGESKPLSSWLAEKEDEIRQRILEQQKILKKYFRAGMNVGDRARLLVLFEAQIKLTAGMQEPTRLTNAIVKSLTNDTPISYPAWYHPDGSVELTEAEIEEYDKPGQGDEVPF